MSKTTHVPPLLDRGGQEKIARRLARAAPKLLLALDFDGTVAPIVERPEDARLPEAWIPHFRALAQRIEVVMISGRSRADLLARLPDDSAARAWGSHGFEADPGAAWTSPLATPAHQLDELGTHLEEEMARHRLPLTRLRLERKSFSLVLHYRTAPELGDAAQLVARRACDRTPGSWRCEPGRKIVEIRPDVDWGKGSALMGEIDARGLLDRGWCFFYAGDDVTDESVFEALAARVDAGQIAAHRVTTLLVSERGRESSAQARLRSPAELHHLLSAIPRTLEG